MIVPIWLAGFASPALRADCLSAPPGLVAWWRMDEASLDVAEDVLGIDATTNLAPPFLWQPLTNVSMITGDVQVDLGPPAAATHFFREQQVP